MTGKRAGAGGETLIKKYGNRRLYDTDRSRYITLDELAGIVQGGAKVRVVEEASGKDITRQVLLQVILERDERVDLVPAELLHAILRVQGTVQQGPLAAYLAEATRLFSQAGALWARQVDALLGGAAGLPTAGAPAATSSAAASAEATKDAAASTKEPSAGSAPPPEDLRERMSALLKRLGGG
ncbi:MAG: polyhydroxyalkanoate synthesis regulator DNA-binding domain-containing protein [Deltaproteobacteria bacterium]|nr:polyhydroxyalkanoate synthesis regulator DNA-binding domain-containing protein [Deltaproteobacteria bacterium]